jgi:hypothetical protein
MEPEFHGLQVQVLLEIFDEFIALYNDPAFQSQVIESSGGKKEEIGRVIEQKQREVFEAHHVPPAKGTLLMILLISLFSHT